MERINQQTTVSLVRSYDNVERVREVRDLTPRHALEIDAHSELRREIAKLCEARNKAGPVWIIAANTQASGAQRVCRLKHSGKRAGGEVLPDGDELDVINSNAFVLQATLHLSRRRRACRQLVERR